VPAEYGPYLQAFRRRVQEALAYPLAARRQRAEGTVELEVVIEPSGRVAQVRVVSSSAQPALDEAAVEAVRGLRPVPIPGHLPKRELRVRLPLVFQLR
jgi:protein TonB